VGGRRNFFRRNLQTKFVSAPPGKAIYSILRTFFAGREDLEVHLVPLDRLLRARRLEKKVVNFLRKKVHD